MPEIYMNLRLSEEQQRYAAWIEEKMPFLMLLFDFKRREYLPQKVRPFLQTASHGQAIMARFALSVWRHDNNYEFNIVDAVRYLDVEHIETITEWMKDPFWP